MFRRSAKVLMIVLVATAAQTVRAQQTISVPDVYIPTQCFQGGELTKAACDVIGAAKLGKDFSEALEKPDARHELAKVFAESAANKVVIASFPKQMAIDGRLALVQLMYQSEVKFFGQIEQRIEKEMLDNPTHAAWLRTQAKLDSQAVQSLRAQVFAQQKSVADAAESYLTGNSGAVGTQFQCLLACQQLISAAQGVNVFDTATVTSNHIVEPKHSHTGLIVGGVLAAGGAGAAAYEVGKLAKNSSSSSSQSCTANPPAQCGAFGPGDPPGCFQGQAFLNALASYCSSCGFPSGHNLGTFSCP